MTRFSRDTIACRLCGTESRHRVLLSSNTFGGLPDLDGRPPEMLRRTMPSWVQRCPGCGLCATDLAKEFGGVLPVVPLRDLQATGDLQGSSATETSSERREFFWSVVHDGRYQAQLSDWRLPQLANSFLCQSLLEEADHQYGRAARAALHAAWTCDDQPLRKRQAMACRRRAVQLIHEAARRGQEVESEEWTGKVLLTDILRRSCDFASAAEECQRELVLERDERLRSLFEYEALLIQRRDSERRSLVDVIRWAPAVWEVQAPVRGATEARVVGIGVGLLISIGYIVVAFVLGPILLVLSVILLVGLVALSLVRRLRA